MVMCWTNFTKLYNITGIPLRQLKNLSEAPWVQLTYSSWHQHMQLCFLQHNVDQCTVILCNFPHLDGMLIYCRLLYSILLGVLCEQFAGTQFYFILCRGREALWEWSLFTMKTTKWTWPGLKPGPASCALNLRLLHQNKCSKYYDRKYENLSNSDCFLQQLFPLQVIDVYSYIYRLCIP